MINLNAWSWRGRNRPNDRKLVPEVPAQQAQLYQHCQEERSSQGKYTDHQSARDLLWESQGDGPRPREFDSSSRADGMSIVSGRPHKGGPNAQELKVHRGSLINDEKMRPQRRGQPACKLEDHQRRHCCQIQPTLSLILLHQSLFHLSFFTNNS